MTKRLLSWAVCALGLGVLLGCASRMPKAPSGEETRYHQNWWNFYRQGLAHLQEKNFPAAKENFEVCLGLRGGAVSVHNQDQWRVRTYGMHIQKSYFPNREMGVSLFYLNRPEEALPYLLQSLDQEPSGRGKHFINECRRALLAGKAMAPPTLAFDPETRVRWTPDRTRILKGEVEGAGFVDDLFVGGRPVFNELAEHTERFSEPIRLQEGPNPIAVRGVDLLGQEIIKTITWMADFTPPMLNVVETRKVGLGAEVIMACRDNFGLATCRTEAEVFFEQKSGEPKRTLNFTFNLIQGQSLSLRAVDLAGNEVVTDLSYDDVVQTAGLSAPRQYAGLNAGVSGGNGAKPLLTLNRSADRFLVFNDEFWLDGWVRDENRVKTIRVNQQILDVGDPAPQCYFSTRIPLTLGTNQVQVSCRNETGGVSERRFLVVRKKPEYLKDRIRLRALVNDFEVRVGGVNAGLLKSRFEHFIREDPVRFYLLNDQSPGDRERALAQTDLVDPRAKLDVTSRLRPELFFAGGIDSYREGYTLAVHAFDEQPAGGASALPLYTEDVYLPHGKDEIAHYLAGLAMKLEQRYPAAEGQIVKFRGWDKVMLDIGSSSGIQEGFKYVVVSPDPEQPDKRSSFLRYYEGSFIELTVTRIADDYAIAEVAPRKARATLSIGDFCYAR